MYFYYMSHCWSWQWKARFLHAKKNCMAMPKWLSNNFYFCVQRKDWER